MSSQRVIPLFRKHYAQWTFIGLDAVIFKNRDTGLSFFNFRLHDNYYSDN